MFGLLCLPRVLFCFPPCFFFQLEQVEVASGFWRFGVELVRIEVFSFVWPDIDPMFDALPAIKDSSRNELSNHPLPKEICIHKSIYDR